MKYLNNSFYHRNPQNLIFRADASLFPQIEHVCQTIEESIPFDRTFARLTDLYIEDNEAYEYAKNSPALYPDFLFSTAFAESFNLGINELKEIEKAYIANTAFNETLIEYIANSDRFRKESELSDYISQFKTNSDITVYRAERDTGIFDSIIIEDSPLADKVRTINEENKEQTAEEKILPNTRKYIKNEIAKVNLYDYIRSKSVLSLSDAMLIAKYGDEEFIKTILSVIENTELIDERFKSTSFSEHFVDFWRKTAKDKDRTTIKQKLVIKKGTEGVFDSTATRQAEFVLNNKKKLFSYSKAQYDRETNTFILEATVKNI